LSAGVSSLPAWHLDAEKTGGVHLIILGARRFAPHWDIRLRRLPLNNGVRLRMEAEKVIRIIESAFEGVRLGAGIGLWEAQAIDDYETESIQRKNRAKDEKDEWKNLKTEDLQRCHSSLSFFDADGMKFHLPAYIISTLKGEDVEDPVFHLVGLDEYALSRFTSLDSKQKGAVRTFLEWCSEQEEFEFEGPNITRALNEFWCN